MSQSQTDFDEAVIRQWTWKSPAMKAMTLAVCRLALDRAGSEFSANDLPEFNHGGQGIAGQIGTLNVTSALRLHPRTSIKKANADPEGGKELVHVEFNINEEFTTWQAEEQERVREQEERAARYEEYG